MHLGTEATAKTYNLAAVSYLKKISLDYYGVGGNKQWQRSGLVCVCVAITQSSPVPCAHWSANVVPVAHSMCHW